MNFKNIFRFSIFVSVNVVVLVYSALFQPVQASCSPLTEEDSRLVFAKREVTSWDKRSNSGILALQWRVLYFCNDGDRDLATEDGLDRKMRIDSCDIERKNCVELASTTENHLKINLKNDECRSIEYTFILRNITPDGGNIAKSGSFPVFCAHSDSLQLPIGDPVADGLLSMVRQSAVTAAIIMGIFILSVVTILRLRSFRQK